MTIDIVGLIREIDKDGSGEIEYEEFKMLLKSGFANEGNWYLYSQLPLSTNLTNKLTNKLMWNYTNK